MNEGLVLEDSIVLNYGCIISFHFFFSRDAHFLWPIVGLDCLGHQFAGCSPIDPFGNAYDLHLSVFRVLGLINACILCLFWLRFCFYDQYSSIYTLAYWLRTPNLCQIQHSLLASQIILRKLPLLTHAVTRPRHGSRVSQYFPLKSIHPLKIYKLV